MSELNDPDLAAARAGDPAAFRRLVAVHGRAVYQLCWRITRDADLAEDAAQETFYKVWRSLDGFDGRAAFSTWLHRIAANAALEQLRRNARHANGLPLDPVDADAEAGAPFLDASADAGPEPVDAADGGQLGRRIDVELRGMSALERSAFVLRHVQGESLEDIARQLSINVGQSKQAIFRAVRKLRGALQDWR